MTGLCRYAAAVADSWGFEQEHLPRVGSVVSHGIQLPPIVGKGVPPCRIIQLAWSKQLGMVGVLTLQKLQIGLVETVNPIFR